MCNTYESELFPCFVRTLAMWENENWEGISEMESKSPSPEMCISFYPFLISTASKDLSFFFCHFPDFYCICPSIIDHRGFLNLSASSIFYMLKNSLKTYIQWSFTYSKQLLTSKHIVFLLFYCRCYFTLFILFFLTNPYFFFSWILSCNLVHL